MDRKIFFSFCLLVAATALVHSVCAAAPLMIEKNLFDPTRKAPAAESEVTVQPSALAGLALASIQLDGVMIQGNARKALVRLKNVPPAPTGVPGVKVEKAKSPFMSVGEGQQIGEFRVAKVDVKSIAVEKDGQSFVINLIAANKVVSPPAPSLAPQAGVQPTMQPVQPDMSGNPPNQVGMAQPQIQPAQQGFQGQAPPPNPGTPGYDDSQAQQVPGQVVLPQPNPGQQPQMQPVMPEEQQGEQ